MHGGFFTIYANKNIKPNNRVSIFTNNEPKLNWTSLLLSEIPDGEIFLVGGTLRDIILGKIPNDIDLVIRNIKPEILKKWLTNHGTVKEIVSNTFGTLKFTPSNFKKSQPIDIALPRTEVIADRHNSGRKDLQISSSYKTKIKDDLARRDLTINAMAFNIKTKNFLDPFNGLQDLDNGIIKTVLNPEDRFYEDATRILRALRFASQLDFSIEKNTWYGILNSLDFLNNKTLTEQGTYAYVTPREAIGREFLLGFIAHPTHTLKLWNDSQALQIFLPEIKNLNSILENSDTTAMQQTIKTLTLLKNQHFLTEHNLEFATPDTLIAALFALVPEKSTAATSICKKLYLTQFPKSNPNRVELDNVIWMLNNLELLKTTDPASMRPSQFEKIYCSKRGRQLLLLVHAIHYASNKFSIERERVLIAKRIAQDFYKYKINSPRLITGSDIQKLGIKPGKEYRELLDFIRDAQLVGQISSSTEAIKILKKKISQI